MSKSPLNFNKGLLLFCFLQCARNAFVWTVFFYPRNPPLNRIFQICMNSYILFIICTDFTHGIR